MTMKPTIHFNGTSRGDLHAGYMNALIAVEEALKMVQATSPHGRDDYPQGAEAIVEATLEHRKRMQDLEAIQADFEKLACFTMPTT